MNKYNNDDILTKIGVNPYTSEKDGLGSGMIEGLASVADPLGILAQYVGRKMGYDIRTVGGVGFFSGVKTDISNPKETTGSIVGKVGTAGLGVGCWFNPAAIPYLLFAEGVSTIVNVVSNVKRYKANETLRLEDKL